MTVMPFGGPGRFLTRLSLRLALALSVTFEKVEGYFLIYILNKVCNQKPIALLKSNKYAKKNLAMWLLFWNFFVGMGTNKPLIKKSFRSQSNYFTYTSGSKQSRRIDRFDTILWSNIDGYYITINGGMLCRHYLISYLVDRTAIETPT